MILMIMIMIMIMIDIMVMGLDRPEIVKELKLPMFFFLSFLSF